MQFKEIGDLFKAGENGNKGEFASNIWSILGLNKKSKGEDVLDQLFEVDAKKNISKYNLDQINKKGKALGLNSDDLNLMLSKASDAGFFEKAKAGTITWNEALKDSKNSVEDIADALKKTGKIDTKKIDECFGDTFTSDQSRAKLQGLVKDVDGLGDALASVGSKTSSTGFFGTLKSQAMGAVSALKSVLPVLAGDLSYTGEVHAQKLIIADEGLKQENSNNSLVISQSNNSILTLSDKEKKVLYFDENNILNFVGNATINKLTLKNSDFVQVGTILGNSSQNINSSSSSFSVSSTGMLKTNNSVLYNSQILNKKNNFYSGFLNGDISLFIGADDENGTNAIFSVENSGIVKNIKVRDPWDTQSNVVTCDNDSKINIKYVDEYIEFYDETTLIAKIKNGYGI